MTNHNHSNNPVHQNSYQNNACGSKQQLWYELLSKVQKVSHKDFELLFNQIIEFLDENISNSTDKQYKESCIEKLVDIYLQTFSDRIFKILTSISSPLDECLLNTLMKKININGTSLEKRFNVFILISEIIHRSPSWLPNIINRSLLNWFFQILKNEQEIVILAISALILVELMAALPCHMSQCLDDIFSCFYRLSWFLYKGSKADIEKMSSSDSVDRKRLSFLNLNSIVYRVFLRLYAMYPCNFLHFLKTNYGIGCNNKESCLVYVEIIEPMLAKIRFHPLLITSSKDQECDKSRWFYKEPHDILDECSQYSIDPVESTFFDFELSDLYRLFRKNEDGGDEEDDKSSPLMDDDDDENVEENFDSIYDQNSDSIFSELARQTESKKDINDVDLAKRRLNNPKTNSESAQEAIILSKKVSQTCAAPSCSMVDHRIDQQQNNLIKPVAVSAAENSFSSSSSKNPRANFQIKKQCFSPFKPINDSSEISDFSFDETSSDKKMDRLNQIENESFVSNNDNEDVDMEIMSYNLGRKSSKNLNDFPDDNRINGFNDNVNTNEKIMDKSPFDAGNKPIDDSLASFKHINIRTRYQSHCLADTFNNQDENDMNDPSLSSLSTKSISRSCPILYSNIRDILSLETNANELEDDRKNRTNDHSAKQHRNSESKIILKTGENDSNIGECLKQSKKIRNKTCKSVDFTKEIKSYFSYNQSSILHQNSKITNLDRLLLSFRDSRKFLYQSSSSIDFVGNLNKFEINSPHQLLDRTLSTLSDVYLKDSIETKRKTSEEIVMDQNQANRSDSIEHISSLDYLNSNLNDEDMRKILAILYAQLVFERHQRDLHVIRNRRLYKKAKDFIQLEEKLHTIEEQARLRTNEIGKLQSVLDRSSKQFDLERKQFGKEINNLNETLIRFKANYDELMKEKINLELHYKQEIDNLNQNFRMNELELNRYLCSGNKNVDLAKLEKENQELKNQIFFFGEFCGKVRDAYYQNKSQPAIYDKILFESLRNENEDLQQKNRDCEAQLKTMLDRCSNLENQLRLEENRQKDCQQSKELEYFRETLKAKDQRINALQTLVVDYMDHIRKLNNQISAKLSSDNRSETFL